MCLKPAASAEQANFSDRPLRRIALSDPGRAPFPYPSRSLRSPPAGVRCRTHTSRSPARKSRRPDPPSVEPKIALLLRTGFASGSHACLSTLPNAAMLRRSRSVGNFSQLRGCFSASLFESGYANTSRGMPLPQMESGFTSGDSRLMTNGAVRASLVESSVVKPAALLFVGDHDVEHVMSLRVLALEGRGARFSVFGDFRSDGHHHLAALLHCGLYRVGADSLYRHRVGVGEAGNRIVLAVEFCVVLNVKVTSVGIGALGVDLDAVLVDLDLYRGVFRRGPRTVLRLIGIHLPGSGMLIGSRCCNCQSEGPEQQYRCENDKLVASHLLSSDWGFWDGPIGVDVMLGNSRKVQRIFCKSPWTPGECERESRSTKNGQIVSEVNFAPGTEATLCSDGLLGEQVRGDFAEVPDDAEPGHDFQRVVGDVDLPPKESLARRGHEVMMIVVPAFAEGEQREEPVVAAGVGGLVAARAKEVRERIDGESVMPQKHRAQAEAPHKQVPSANQPQCHA